MVSLTVIAVKLNSTASIILFRKDYLSQRWSFQVKEMHPQVSVSFIKCDRNSIGTSEKVDPIWRKDAWNGGMAEYPKHRMAENAYIERFQLLQLRWIIPEKKHCNRV